MSLLAIDWGSVWTVTFLGFGLVFVILILLIFILQGFGKIFAAEEKAEEKKAAAPAAPAAATKKAAKAADASEVEKAAIAMALHLYFNAVHDTESYKLTLQTKPTAWNDKSYGMNNIGF